MGGEGDEVKGQRLLFSIEAGAVGDYYFLRKGAVRDRSI
jgi:hypothetical protein